MSKSKEYLELSDLSQEEQDEYIEWSKQEEQEYEREREAAEYIGASTSGA